MTSPLAWFVAFLATLAIEAPIVLALTRGAGATAARRFGFVVFGQLATHPLVWFVFPRLAGFTGQGALALSEVWAWLAEAALYALALPDVRPTRALGASAVANGASVLLGIALAGWLQTLA